MSTFNYSEDGYTCRVEIVQDLSDADFVRFHLRAVDSTGLANAGDEWIASGARSTDGGYWPWQMEGVDFRWRRGMAGEVRQ